MDSMNLSLEALEKKIEEYINYGAFVIYWNHQVHAFNYLLESDQEFMTLGPYVESVPKKMQQKKSGGPL